MDTERGLVAGQGRFELRKKCRANYPFESVSSESDITREMPATETIRGREMRRGDHAARA